MIVKTGGYMKSRKILLAFALILGLSSCSNLTGNAKGNVSEQTIEKALKEDPDKDNNKDLLGDKVKADKEDSDKKDIGDALNKIDYAKIRQYIVDIGQFNPAILDELSDEDIKEYYVRAKAASEKTGYWDIKDFIFQELAKDYENYSNKFPLESIETLYNWPKSTDKVTDKYEDERKAIANLGYDEDEIAKISDKKLEEAFKKAYDKKPEGLYNDYVELAGEELFSKDSKSEDKTLKFGEKDSDYEEFKKSLVDNYEFKQDAVDKMTNDDIDKAYTRAQKKLEQTGFGDIGLIINELAKMYPGSSTMYPGE